MMDALQTGHDMWADLRHNHWRNAQAFVWELPFDSKMDAQHEFIRAQGDQAYALWTGTTHLQQQVTKEWNLVPLDRLPDPLTRLDH